jgi:hypothetical protein
MGQALVLSDVGGDDRKPVTIDGVQDLPPGHWIDVLIAQGLVVHEERVERGTGLRVSAFPEIPAVQQKGVLCSKRRLRIAEINEGVVRHLKHRNGRGMVVQLAQLVAGIELQASAESSNVGMIDRLLEQGDRLLKRVERALRITGLIVQVAHIFQHVGVRDHPQLEGDVRQMLVVPRPQLLRHRQRDIELVEQAEQPNGSLEDVLKLRCRSVGHPFETQSSVVDDRRFIARRKNGQQGAKTRIVFVSPWRRRQVEPLFPRDRRVSNRLTRLLDHVGEPEPGRSDISLAQGIGVLCQQVIGGAEPGRGLARVTIPERDVGLRPGVPALLERRSSRLPGVLPRAVDMKSGCIFPSAVQQRGDQRHRQVLRQKGRSSQAPTLRYGV